MLEKFRANVLNSCYFKKYIHVHVYIRSLSSSFEHNMPKIPFVTNEHQEKLTAGMYKMSNVLKM